jgi:hypothetical protein
LRQLDDALSRVHHPDVNVSTLAGWTFVAVVLAVSIYVMVKGKDD